MILDQPESRSELPAPELQMLEEKDSDIEIGPMDPRCVEIADKVSSFDRIVQLTPKVSYIKYSHWWKTKELGRAGQDWLKDGFYCPFPEDTKAYDEYWDEQEYYVRNGYTHEGQYVPGLEHLYLNFTPIWNKRQRRWIFPDFRPVDTEWFDEVEKAMGIGQYMNAEWKEYRPPVHITSKTRQSGHSLKGVVPVVYNMHFVPGSRNFIGAYQKPQAQKTNKMYQQYHKHLFLHTAWGKGWLRKDEDEEYLTGYQERINGQDVDKGFLSYLKLVGFSDGFPEKAVGGGVDLFVLEEIGIFPGLISAINYLLPSVKDGDITTGTILGFGAAGSLKKARDLQELSYNPEGYGCWAYNNIWAQDPRDRNKKTVYFVPNYSCRPPHMDEDGNPKQEAAIKAKERSLAQLKKTNHEKYLEAVSQTPNSMEEMFAVRQRTRFSKEILEPHVRYLEAHKGQLSHFVDLWEDPESKRIYYKFVDREPIWEYPIELDKISPERLEGTTEIFEFPDPNPPAGLYIASIDSYNQQSTTKKKNASMGCIQIFKKISNLSGETTSRILVAEHVARPSSKNKFYENCLYLLRLYNATALPENEDTELVPWFYNEGYAHLLADQPDIIRQYIPNSNVKRAKGIHAAWPLIIAGENKIERYIEEKLGTVYDEEGTPVGIRWGASRILSLGTARELLHYVSNQQEWKEKESDDYNFDRQRTFGWVLLYEEETFTETPASSEQMQNAASFLNNTNRFGTPNDGLVPGGGYYSSTFGYQNP